MGRMTLTEEIVVAVATMLAASLSFFGSSYIICLIVWKRKYKQHTYQRIMLGACAFDLFNSIGWFMAPLAPPKGSSPRALSIGNTASCTSQAFMLQAGVGFLIYNACLSIYYVLTIRYNVSKARMIWREKIMHTVSVVWGLGAAIVPIPMEIYNELGVGSGCWLGQFPQYCGTEENPVPCERGANINPAMVGYIIAGFPSVVSLIIVIVCNLMVFSAVRKQEVATRRYAVGNLGRRGRLQQRLNATAAQASWYVVVYLNSLFWQLLLRFMDSSDAITWTNESSFTCLILFAQFFSASSGFGFLMVYVRPRYLRHREKKLSPLVAMAVALSFRNPPSIHRGCGNRGDPESSLDNDGNPCSSSEY